MPKVSYKLIAIMTLYIMSQSPIHGAEPTKFRGLALGDSIENVRDSLEKIGLRCLSSRDLDKIGASNEVKEILSPLSICWIWPVVVNMDQYPTGLPTKYEVTMGALGDRYSNAILFTDATVSAMLIGGLFFNAEGMGALEFTRNIAESYPLTDGLAPIDGGWTGKTLLEQLTVHSSQDQTNAMLEVRALADERAPKFN